MLIDGPFIWKHFRMKVCLQDWIFGEPNDIEGIETLSCATRRGITYQDPSKANKPDADPQIFEFRYGGSYNIYLTANVRSIN